MLMFLESFEFSISSSHGLKAGLMTEKNITKPCIIVHGGAFNIPESYVQRYTVGTQEAANVGYQCLLKVNNTFNSL